MLKFDNTCTEYPNMTRVLDEMLYSKRKTQNISQTVLENLIGRSRNCVQQAECYEHLPAFSPSCTRRMRWNLVMKNSPV